MSPIERVKSIVILQSNYIPWKGYFDLMAAADEFLIFDEVQFTRRDWRNRNRIILNGALHWLTIPVASKGRFDASIDSMQVTDLGWADKHWKTIRQAYRSAPFFGDYADRLEALYAEVASLELLTEINETFLRAMAAALDIDTPILRTDAVPRRADTPTGRLVEICVARGATEYISGPAAKAYIERERFAERGIGLSYADYADYPIYAQPLPAFEHGVSILDLLFRFGPDARDHLKSPRNRTSFVVPDHGQAE